jgi:diacylglycerol kinase (ATP)
MKPKEKVFVVVNPSSGGGVGHRLWPQASQELKKRLGTFDFEETTAIGHAQYLATDAARAGCSLVIAYGGDGTIHEVANGLMEARTQTKPALGIICTGTGGDFVRTLALPSDLADQVRIACGGKSKTIDLGRIRFTGISGQEDSRYFINIASCGISAEVVRRTPRYRAVLGRKPAYLAATLASYFRWKPKKVTLATDHGPLTGWPERPMTIVVANGRFFGGGMPIAPNADPSDGYFDLVAIDQMPAYSVPVFLSLLYSRQIHRMKRVYHDRVRKVHLVSEGRVDLDIDGEPLGSLPASFEIVPAALDVRTPS